MPSFEGNILTHTKLPRKKLETRLSYSEDPESVSHLALNSYRVVTDRRTDGRTDG